MQGVAQGRNLGMVIEAPAGVVRGGQQGFRVQRRILGGIMDCAAVAVLKGRVQELGQLPGMGRQRRQAGAVAGNDLFVAQDALRFQHLQKTPEIPVQQRQPAWPLIRNGG